MHGGWVTGSKSMQVCEWFVWITDDPKVSKVMSVPNLPDLLRNGCLRLKSSQGIKAPGCFWIGSYVNYVYVCMYVCMYVCTYVCMYVCMSMYVCQCMYVNVCMSMYVCQCMYVNVCMSMYVCQCMYEWMNVCMYECMYVRMYVCMYVCVYVKIELIISGKRKVPQTCHARPSWCWKSTWNHR